MIDGLQVELGQPDNTIALVSWDEYLELPLELADVPARFVWQCPLHGMRHVFTTIEQLVEFALTWNQSRDDFSRSCIVGGVL